MAAGAFLSPVEADQFRAEMTQVVQFLAALLAAFGLVGLGWLALGALLLPGVCPARMVVDAQGDGGGLEQTVKALLPPPGGRRTACAAPRPARPGPPHGPRRYPWGPRWCRIVPLLHAVMEKEPPDDSFLRRRYPVVTPASCSGKNSFILGKTAWMKGRERPIRFS